ncbi:SET and MYND domain-containing protein 4-like isoform X2 [Venturia canescens]|uniref:SET and MYND domain-containing protein 4-like isoform X2 n=1 Tax=Venturia canescens TaxID=32260 RepID=UPI001C9CB10B|nr:SET and MYND domain-containing protein 4-like isoform X2 [Venturia canescens]
MPLRKSEALGEFHQLVHDITSTKTFVEQFQCLSKKCDRRGMIKILLDIAEVAQLRVQESYHEKDDEEAEKIYRTYQTLPMDRNDRGIFVRTSFLTKAFFAATPRSMLFKDILLERARCWYSANLFTRCLKDCDYLMNILNGTENDLIDSIPLHNHKMNVECTELISKCIESLKRANKASRKAPNKIVPLPHIEGKLNSKMPSCSNSVIQCYDRIRGRHLVSTRNIKTGSVILIDQPFSFSTDIQSLSTNCLHCHISLNLQDNVRIPCQNCQTVSYCSNRCRQQSWQKYHKYECKIFDYFYEINGREVNPAQQRRSHLLLAWRTTIESAIDKTRDCLRDDWLSYQESSSNQDNNSRETYFSIDPYDSSCYQTVFALETHCSDSSTIINLSRSVCSIFFTKCLELVFLQNHPSSTASIDTNKLLLVAVGMLRHMQSVDCNAYEIVENIRDETTRIWGPRNVGGAIYPTVSLINHGCYPNVVRHSYPHDKNYDC